MCTSTNINTNTSVDTSSVNFVILYCCQNEDSRNLYIKICEIPYIKDSKKTRYKRFWKLDQFGIF